MLKYFSTLLKLVGFNSLFFNALRLVSIINAIRCYLLQTLKTLTVNQRVLGSSPRGGATKSATYEIIASGFFHFLNIVGKS
jgi:hypothetical protein